MENRSIDSERRFGKFSISWDFFLNNFQEVKSLLSGVVVLKAINSFMLNTIECEGWSDMFDIVDEGQISPTYQLYRQAEIVPEEDRERIGFSCVERLYFIKEGEKGPRPKPEPNKYHRALRIRRKDDKLNE